MWHLGLPDILFREFNCTNRPISDRMNVAIAQYRNRGKAEMNVCSF